ncbi:PAS domain-containing protein [Holophaga foetida]|uniref:PAS domain-containing protein n=1 Tax=Holophaga foetida TaxID=35839 RepID=UPI00130E285A|nr:PAS domain-containing protein [Holophaga foetida]
MTSAIPFLSALLQLAAAILALRLTRLARGSWGWVFLAAALLLMAVRRGMAGWEILAAHRLVPISEWVSLAISFLMVVGMVGVGGLLRAGRRAEAALIAAESRAREEQERIARREILAQEILEQGEAARKAAELGCCLALMIECTDVWISALDMDGRVVIWNRAAEDISGYSREELLGHNDFWEWLYPDSGERAILASEVDSLIRRGGQLAGVESTLRRKDGTHRRVSWYICPVLGVGGVFSGTFSIGHDVTALRGSGEDVQRIRTFQNLILDNSALGLALVRNRVHTWANPRAAEILGVHLGELEGRPTRDSFPDEKSYQDFGTQAYGLLAQGGYADIRVRMRRGNGTPFWCRMVGRAMDPAHVQEGSVWMMEDITARMTVESALTESEERFRGAFEGTLDALLLLTPKGIFDCNYQALRLFGLEDKSEILQRGLKDLCPVRQPGGEASGEALGHHIQSALVGETARFNWTFRRRGAGDFAAEVYMNSFPMGRRKVLLACVRPAQVIELKSSESSQELGMRAFLDLSPVATMIVDTQAHRFVYCNRAALTILRCRMDEIYGLGPGDLSPMYQPDGRPSKTFSDEMNAIAMHGGSHRFRHVHRSPHREDFAVDVTLTALQPGFSPLLVVTWSELIG